MTQTNETEGGWSLPPFWGRPRNRCGPGRRSDRMQEHYARAYRTLWERHWWWRSREALVLDQIRRLHARTPLDRILDVGCGDGLLFGQLERFGRVEGLEPDASVLTELRWRSRIKVGMLGPNYRAAEPFDLVLMLDVLEHIENDGEALVSAFETLKPGGHLLVTVPALPWLWSRHDEANEHHRRYFPGTLRKLLVAAGFVLETLRYAFFWTVAPLLARRWLSPAGSSAARVADYAVKIPPEPINQTLNALSRCDHAIGRILPWPFGSSILVVARKPL